MPKVAKLTTTKSGLQYSVISHGSGKKVSLGKEVAFHWTGYLAKGIEFSSSRKTEPFYFITGQNQVIKGAEEGLLKMREGDQYLLIMPPELTYGSKGSGKGLPPNATLTFNYEVVSVSPKKENINPLLKQLLAVEPITEVAEEFYNTKQTAPNKYSYRENGLNGFGYKLLNEKGIQEAVAMFEINTTLYPNYWNPWDSMGNGYYQNQQWHLALNAFERSVELYRQAFTAKK